MVLGLEDPLPIPETLPAEVRRELSPCWRGRASWWGRARAPETDRRRLCCVALSELVLSVLQVPHLYNEDNTDRPQVSVKGLKGLTCERHLERRLAQHEHDTIIVVFAMATALSCCHHHQP